MWGQLSTTCSNATEVAQWAAPSCSRLQPATDNPARSNYPLTPTIQRAVSTELHVLHCASAGYKSQDLLHPLGREHATLEMPDCCAVNHGI